MRKEIIVNSINRTSGTSENFQINYNYNFLNKIKRVKLISAIIPMTFTNVMGGSFNIIGSITRTINVPENKYTIQSLTAFINEIFLTFNIIYKLSYDINNKFIFESTELFSLDFTNSSLNNIFGFPLNYISSSLNKVVSLSSTSYYFNIDNYLCICSNSIKGIDNGEIILKNNINQEFILHSLPMCCSGTIKYSNFDDAPWVNIINKLDSFYLKFTNNFPVNINGNEWSIKLLCEM